MVPESLQYSLFLIMNLVALEIYLLITADLKKFKGGVFAGDNPESRTKRRIFLMMCSLAIFEGAVSVINDVIYIMMNFLQLYTESFYMQVFQPLGLFISETVSTLLTLLWMIFVDFCVYKSPEHIRKRYPPYYVIAGAGIVFSALSMIFTITTYPEPDLPAVVFMLASTFMILPVIQLIFVITAYRIVAGYKMERRPPLFLRLSVFIIPVVLGCVIGVFIHPCFRSLGFAIGLWLTLRVQRDRSRYIDQETGFYTQDFLLVMYDHLEKKGYLNGMGIIFSAPESRPLLIKAVSQLDYDNSEIFLLEDGTVLYTTGEQKKDTIELIIRYVKTCISGEDPSAEINTEIIERDKGESAGSFTDKILRSVKNEF